MHAVRSCAIGRGKYEAEIKTRKASKDIVAQYVSFLITGMEQTTLIQYYFSAVVIECGALMLKRVSEVIVARIKKKEQIEPETDTDESEVL